MNIIYIFIILQCISTIKDNFSYHGNWVSTMVTLSYVAYTPSLIHCSSPATRTSNYPHDNATQVTPRDLETVLSFIPLPSYLME